MVNLINAQKPLIKGLMKCLVGLTPRKVEIEPGTVISMWVPSRPSKKPALVLIHGFAADGITTWQLQVGPLSHKYAIYVPDLLFFGGSSTCQGDRTPEFQAECMVKALREVGVHKCPVVRFSYGGLVAFKMAELHPCLVFGLVVSGSALVMSESVSETVLSEQGFSNSAELLLPNSVNGLKALLSVSSYKKLWFPKKVYRDYLKAMFTNREERQKLLENLVVSSKDASIPKFSQSILLLWGEEDKVFNFELAKIMKEQLGDKVVLQSIKKAGHLVHVERPCVYTRGLKKFLALCTHANEAS